MSVKDHGLPHHHAKQHEASERMRVSHVINPPSIPNSPSPSVTSSPSDPPSSPATSETLAHERSPHSRDAPRLCLSVRGKRRWVTPSPELELSGIPVLLEAANYQEDFYRKRKCVTPDPTPTPSVHDDASRPSRSPELTREYKEQPPSPSKRTERLPGYSEIAKFAGKEYVGQEDQGAEKESTPSTLGYWQTSSSRSSRNNSSERPMFNDPFIFGGSELRMTTQPMRPHSSTENYTTRSEAKPPFLQTHLPLTYEHRRSSVKSEYEPRIPTLPSMFPQTQATTSTESSPTAPRLSGYPSTPAHSQPPPLAGSPQDGSRHSEAAYAVHGYGAAYGNDHYRQRSSWATDVAGYPRYPPRHDSSVFGPPESHWPYGYAGPYAYSIDSAQATADGPFNRRRRGNLPKEATAQLKAWFASHSESPYPTDEEKNALASRTGLTQAQISNWFINARRRNPGREAREQVRMRNTHR